MSISWVAADRCSSTAFWLWSGERYAAQDQAEIECLAFKFLAEAGVRESDGRRYPRQLALTVSGC
jgi:hypothetical protein